MLSRFFWNYSKRKLLAPQAVDIHSWNLIISLCFTLTKPFNIFLFVKLCIGQQKYKQKFSTQGRKEWPHDQLSEQPSKWIRARSLNSYFASCKIVIKMRPIATFCCCFIQELGHVPFVGQLTFVNITKHKCFKNSKESVCLLCITITIFPPLQISNLHY